MVTVYWSLSYIITESESQHAQVREAILNHLVCIEDFMIGHHISSEYSSTVDYISGTDMDRDGMWDSITEILTASHMLLSVHDTSSRTWTTYVVRSEKR